MPENDKPRLQELTKEDIQNHYFLDQNDISFYIGDYISGKDYNFGINQIIFNLKKQPSLKISNPLEYQHKAPAIKRVGHIFSASLKEEYLNKKITLVPVPPSKNKSNPDYDDRMLKVCNEIASYADTPDVAEILINIESLDSSHSSNIRSTISELQINYSINPELPHDYLPRELTMIVDDVLTTGRHFKACKNFIYNLYPETKVIGLFVARSKH